MGLLADTLQTMSLPKFELQVPPAKQCILSFPAPNILLVTLNRPNALNCVNMDGHAELDSIWSWMDSEPNLACGIITGKGRAFSAGADLKGMTDLATELILDSRRMLLIGI